jgi:hypothetical protein
MKKYYENKKYNIDERGDVKFEDGSRFTIVVPKVDILVDFRLNKGETSIELYVENYGVFASADPPDEKDTISAPITEKINSIFKFKGMEKFNVIIYPTDKIDETYPNCITYITTNNKMRGSGASHFVVLYDKYESVVEKEKVVKLFSDYRIHLIDHNDVLKLMKKP